MTTINEEKSYSQAPAIVSSAAQGAIDGLGGKLEKQDDGNLSLEVKFDKKILGKVLGERTQMTVQISPDGEGSHVAITAYPLDAIGRPLQFGFRKGVTQTVVNWFVAHLEHRLPD